MTEHDEGGIHFVIEPDMTDEEVEELARTLVEIQDRWVAEHGAAPSSDADDG